MGAHGESHCPSIRIQSDTLPKSRFRIDGVNVDHIQAMTTQEGPISWITSGKVDAVLDVKFPRDHEDEMPLNAIIGEIADAITTHSFLFNL